MMPNYSERLGIQLGTYQASIEQTKIDGATFVKAWMQYNTVEEVAKHLDLTRQQVSSKAHSLRKRGVKLPSKQGKVNHESVDYLNSLITQYSKKG